MSPCTCRRRSSTAFVDKPLDFRYRYVLATGFISRPACVIASSRFICHCTDHSCKDSLPRLNSKKVSRAFVACNCSASPKADRSSLRSAWTPDGIICWTTCPVVGSRTSSTESLTRAASPTSTCPVGSGSLRFMAICWARPRSLPATNGPTASSGPSYSLYHIFSRSRNNFKGYDGSFGDHPGGTSRRYSSSGMPPPAGPALEVAITAARSGKRGLCHQSENWVWESVPGARKLRYQIEKGSSFITWAKRCTWWAPNVKWLSKRTRNMSHTKPEWADQCIEMMGHSGFQIKFMRSKSTARTGTY